MRLLRLLAVSALPCCALLFVSGCGEDGGGFRGAPRGGFGGALGSTAGAGAGGASAGAAGVGGAGGAGAGGDGLVGGQAGSAGADTAGMGGLAAASGAGGIAGDATATGGIAGGSSGSAGGGISGAAGGGAGGANTTAGRGGAAGAGAVSGNAGAGANGGANATGGTSGAGSGGTAGSGGPLKTCGERCNADADCRVFSADQGYHCSATTHRCERFADPCRSAVECVPGASFWFFSCRSDSDCFFFSDDLCVDVGGLGRCARRAPSANGCEDPNPDEITMPRFGSSGTTLVCGNASLTCDAGECVPGCSSNSDCSPTRNGSVCDTTTRLCRCVRDEDCGGAGVSRCNTATGSCECSDSRDCEEVSNTNVCASGRCGCSDVATCSAERTFSGTTYVCE